MKSYAQALIVVALAACAPSTALPAGHPARPDAPVGRLAGPPPALRAGVAASAASTPASPSTPPADRTQPPPREPTPPIHGHHH